MCAIIRKPTTSMPSLRAVLDMLLRDVGLGAVRGDAHRPRAGGVRRVEILDGADAGQQQDGDLRARYALDGGVDPLASVCAPNP